MKKEVKYVSIAVLIFVFNIASNILTAQTVAPAIEWAKCYGGTKGDVGYSIGRTANDGFFLAGYVYSIDGDVTGNHAIGFKADAWLLQLDNSGVITYKQCYGGSSQESAYSTKLTKDGGYIIAGLSSSTDGDVSGFHGGTGDMWIVKLSVSGNIMWQKCLGGTADDEAFDIQQTSDAGYIVAGYTSSNDGDVSGNHGGQDAWVVKLDDTGHVEWQKCLGGSGTESANSILQTADSGYIITGYASSVDGDVSGDHLLTGGGASEDLWVVRLDKNGVLQWQKCLGGSQSEQGNAIRQANDGNYMISGNASSTDGDVTGLHPGVANATDAWIIKMDDTGHVLWNKCYGGSGGELATDLQPAWSGGYVVCGSANSTDWDVKGLRGQTDYWVFKIDENGNLQWQKCMGGIAWEDANSILPTADSGYAITGYTTSRNYDVSGYHDHDSMLVYNGDVWLVKLGKEPTGVATISVASNIAVYPNPSSGVFLVDTDVPKGCSAKVYNMMGSCVYNGVLQAGQNKINLSSEPAGIYFIQLHGNDGSVRTERLVIER